MTDEELRSKIKSCLNRECVPAVEYLKREERSNYLALIAQATEEHSLK